MTKLQALLFDVDGTLVDTEELHRQAFNQAFIELNLGWEWSHDRYAELLKISGGLDRLTQFVEQLAKPADEKQRLRALVPGIHREKTRIYGELLGGGSARLRPGVARLVDEARTAGLKIGFAATSATANVQALIASAFAPAARNAIGAVIGIDHVARRKPAPDVYELLMKTLRVAPADCVAIEDSANGLAAAKAAGLYTIVTPSRWTRAQKFVGADLLLPSLGDPGDKLDALSSAAIGGAPFLALATIASLHENAARAPAGS